MKAKSKGGFCFFDPQPPSRSPPSQIRICPFPLDHRAYRVIVRFSLSHCQPPALPRSCYSDWQALAALAALAATGDSQYRIIRISDSVIAASTLPGPSPGAVGGDPGALLMTITCLPLYLSPFVSPPHRHHSSSSNNNQHKLQGAHKGARATLQCCHPLNSSKRRQPLHLRLTSSLVSKPLDHAMRYQMSRNGLRQRRALSQRRIINSG